MTRRWATECLVVGERPSENTTPVSFIMELQSGHRTIRHKSHMRHSVKSEEKIDPKHVQFMSHVEFSNGTDTAITVEKQTKPDTRLRAKQEAGHRKVWPGNE